MAVAQNEGPVVAVAPDETQPKRVADVIVDTLRDLGIDTFYGICGGAIAPVYDALIDAPDLRVVHTRHETGALFMAAGHALATRSMACVLMTSGPGITNAITGLASAKADGIPVIAIGGEVPKTNFGRGALQEGSRHGLDTIAMVRSVTKYSAEIVNPRSAANVVRRAVATARSGRQGPVFLSLPLDVANERVVPTQMSSNVSTGFAMDDDLIDVVAQHLQDARRGLIVVGSGARHPMACTLVRILAETLQMPVVTTPKAKGLFPERNSLALGVVGYGEHSSAHDYVEAGPDVILAIGCGFGETATNNWRTPLLATDVFIQIDIDSSQIGKNYQVDLGIVGPAQAVLPHILSRLRARPTATNLTGITYASYAPAIGRAPLHPAQVVELLQATFPPDTVYTCDIGEHLLHTLHHLKVDHADGFIAHLGLGSMGSGIGSAIGVKHARPERTVVSICGDYGFQMFGNELATCVEHRIGVVFAILNDARPRMVENGLTNIFGRSLVGGGPPIDFAAFAQAMGARGVCLRTAEDFARLGGDVGRSDVPMVLDIRTDPAASFANNPRFKTISHFGGKGEGPE